MGKIEFSNCQDVRNQKKIQELDCPRCHESGGIEAFVKDGMLHLLENIRGKGWKL